MDSHRSTSDFDPRLKTNDVNDEASESDVSSEQEKDIVFLDTLSQDELQYIVENSTYRASCQIC